MSNELNNILSIHTDGVYEGVAIGGDRYPCSTFIDHLLRYQVTTKKNISSICVWWIHKTGVHCFDQFKTNYILGWSKNKNACSSGRGWRNRRIYRLRFIERKTDNKTDCGMVHRYMLGCLFYRRASKKLCSDYSSYHWNNYIIRNAILNDNHANINSSLVTLVLVHPVLEKRLVQRMQPSKMPEPWFLKTLMSWETLSKEYIK